MPTHLPTHLPTQLPTHSPLIDPPARVVGRHDALEPMAMTSRHRHPNLIATTAAIAAWAGSSAGSQAETPQRVEISTAAALKIDERAASGSRLGLTLRETPATVQVITRAELDALAVIDRQVWGSRGEITLASRLAGMESEFAAGWEASYNRQTRFPLSVNGPFDTTDPYPPAELSFLSLPGISRSYTPGATNQLQTLALFVENRSVLALGWAVISGLRADHITLDVSNHRTTTATHPTVFSTTFNPLTGRLGGVRDLSPTWQVYAQYSTAADPPAGVLATAGYAALRNFDLTTARQVELGSKGSFNQGRGEASVALYQMVRKHLAITDPDDRTKVIPVGQQSSRGVEINLRWHVAPAWQLAGHASDTDAQFDTFVETVQHHRLARWQHTRQHARLGGRPDDHLAALAGGVAGDGLAPCRPAPRQHRQHRVGRRLRPAGLDRQLAGAAARRAAGPGGQPHRPGLCRHGGQQPGLPGATAHRAAQRRLAVLTGQARPLRPPPGSTS